MNILIKKIVFLLPMLLSIVVNAETINREVIGYGINQKEAISNALIEASKQLSGVTISAKEAQATIQKEIHLSNGSREINLTGFKQASVNDIHQKTKGTIQSYRIISLSKDDDLYKANIHVKYEIYTTPGFSPGNRRSIAVLSPKTLKDNYFFSNHPISGRELSRRLQQGLITELTQTRRFSIMDRNYTEDFLEEKKLLESGDASIREHAKIGQVSGVDYLIVGTITEAKLKKSIHQIKTLNEIDITHNGNFRFEYRIIVMATRQIKWSGHADIHFSDKNIPSIIKDSGEALANHMISATSQDIRYNIINNIYPLQIVNIDDSGNLFINQGGETIHKDEHYEVFKQGKKLFDPYTKELIGREEQRVGIAKITRVNPKFSVARMLEGQQEPPSAGMLLRLSKRKHYSNHKNSEAKVQSPAW